MTRPRAAAGRLSGWDAEPLDADDLVAEAERLAGQLSADAIRPDGGGASWLGLDYDAGTRRYRYATAGLRALQRPLRDRHLSRGALVGHR